MNTLKTLSLFLLISAPALMALNQNQIHEIEQLLNSNPQSWYQQNLDRSLNQVQEALSQAQGAEENRLKQLAQALDTRIKTLMAPPPPPPLAGMASRRLPTTQPDVIAPEAPKKELKKDVRQGNVQALGAEALAKPLRRSRPSSPLSKVSEIEDEIAKLTEELNDPKTNKFRMKVLENTEIPKAKARLEEAKKAN